MDGGRVLSRLQWWTWECGAFVVTDDYSAFSVNFYTTRATPHPTHTFVGVYIFVGVFTCGEGMNEIYYL